MEEVRGMVEARIGDSMMGALAVAGSLVLIASQTWLSGPVAHECEQELGCRAGSTCAAAQLVCIDNGCGNGVVEYASGEICDDGNIVDGDGCSGDCLVLERCGDGKLEAEECDMGRDNSIKPNALCRPDCRRPRCGDAILDGLYDEECDSGDADRDGVADDTTACDHDCTQPACGDGIYNRNAIYPNMVMEICDGSAPFGKTGCGPSHECSRDCMECL